MVKETPPAEQPIRGCNKAFKTWHKNMCQTTTEEIATFSSDILFKKAIPEIKVYFEESFGSPERVDYGPVNELNFIVFIMCLYKVGVLMEEDLLGTVNKVFNKYMELMRLLQETYVLASAAEKGIWALD
jgi:hypothetical protein